MKFLSFCAILYAVFEGGPGKTFNIKSVFFPGAENGGVGKNEFTADYVAGLRFFGGPHYLRRNVRRTSLISGFVATRPILCLIPPIQASA